MAGGAGILEIVELAYEAAVEPGRWPTLLERVADALGADSAVLLRGKAPSSAARLDMEAVRLYIERFGALNPVQAAIDRAGEAQRLFAVTTDRSWVDKPELLASAFYNDYFRAFDIHASLMLRLGPPGGGPTLNLLRGRRKGDFDRGEIELATALHGPLFRAETLAGRLRAERRANEALAELVERSAGAILLVERSGRIAYASPAAEAMLRRAEGLRLGAGAITAAGDAGRKLARAIGRATDPDSGGAAAAMVGIPRADGVRPLQLMVSPAGAAAPTSRGRLAVVCIYDPEQPKAVRQDRLCSLFSLTPAEARVVAELVGGGDARAIAGRLGLSVHTVRVQLARAMAKTQTHRRSELVALVIGAHSAAN